MYTSLRKGNNIYDEGPELLLIDGEGEASKEVRSRLQEVDTLHTCSSLFYLIALVLARSCLIKVQVSISCTSCSEKKDQKKVRTAEKIRLEEVFVYCLYYIIISSTCMLATI